MTDIRGGLSRALESRPRLRKLVLYSAASAVGVISSQIVLVTCLALLDMSAVASNVVACVLSAIPNYMINRAWTFGKTGPHSLTREVIPFWSLALLGLVMSTIAVAWAAQRFDDNILAVSGANIGAFGLLWIGKFFILQRYLFVPLARVLEEHTDDSPKSTGVQNSHPS